jgi:NTP pyrophosphatase (non-canonical NTP hydrolase)
VIKFRDARDWAQYHNPKDLAISLSLEASELLEIFQWKDAQEVEAIKSDPESRKRVKEELGDILIYALNMCHAFGFDASGPFNTKEFPSIHAANKGSERMISWQ